MYVQCHGRLCVSVKSVQAFSVCDAVYFRVCVPPKDLWCVHAVGVCGARLVCVTRNDSVRMYVHGGGAAGEGKTRLMVERRRGCLAVLFFPLIKADRCASGCGAGGAVHSGWPMSNTDRYKTRDLASQKLCVTYRLKYISNFC